MKLRPGDIVDRGVWISDDRVYAFVTLSGIEEVGYHGAQPVSRNSRVFAGGEGICRFVTPGIRFEEIDWLPGSAEYRAEGIMLKVACAGRRIEVTGRCASSRSFAMLMDTSALFTDVHGKRVWEEVQRDGCSMTLQFRDAILLDRWMEREGPYAGDFLIPEPLRRKIFSRQCRSGLAAREDLREEYRGVPLPVQEGVVRVRIGGEGYALAPQPVTAGDAEASAERVAGLTAEQSRRLLRFDVTELDKEGTIPPFVLAFDDAISTPPVAGPRRPVTRAAPPVLRIRGFPQVERFFDTVPSLVDSAVIRDLGIPRATPGRYYWIWSWDAMVTAQGALWWGDAALGTSTATFVDRHRDVDGRIPMQWTRSLEPMDTQDPGALDTLLYALAYATYLETGEDGLLRNFHPRMVAFLDRVAAVSDTRGLFAGVGFYPDLPLRFGRTPDSAVAMEVAAFFTFCRICENVSRLIGDRAAAARAAAAASRIEQAFQESFWDPVRQFLLDAVHTGTGGKNESYPLFSLLFLHSPLGLPLLRGKIDRAAEFIAHNHMSPHGLRLLPAWDRNAAAETVSGSWYPHWDVYALSLLRRAGRGDVIMSWLGSVEAALARLGYAPEFVMLDGLPSPEAWARHGAASNLNCVTGWYRALITGLCGLECDPGGLTILALHLPLEKLSLNGIRSHGTTWDCVVRYGGPRLSEVRVDGRALRGCLKIPARYHDGARHCIEVLYGDRSIDAPFAEVTNAQILDDFEGPAGTGLAIRALGSVEVVIRGDHPRGLLVDGRLVAPGPLTGGMALRLELDGVHRLQVEHSGR